MTLAFEITLTPWKFSARCKWNIEIIASWLKKSNNILNIKLPSHQHTNWIPSSSFSVHWRYRRYSWLVTCYWSTANWLIFVLLCSKVGRNRRLLSSQNNYTNDWNELNCNQIIFYSAAVFVFVSCVFHWRAPIN